MRKKLSCILLVDDDEPTNFLNRVTLEEVGCADRIEVAQSGQAALEYLLAAGSIGTGDLPGPADATDMAARQPIPNLIFLDINMPAMDGWEFLSRYEELLRTQRAEVVVVMLTTSLNPEDEIRARGIPSISGFRCKPLTRNMIDSLLRVYFPDYL